MTPNAQLCKLLGLDPELTRRIDIDADGGELVIAAWVTDADTGLINVTTKSYKIAEA